MKLLGFVLMCAVAAVPCAAWADDAKPILKTPATIDEVLYLRTFSLEKGYAFEWRKERPVITEGTILVLQVKLELVRRTQCAEPVLYVGDQTAERVNAGHESGRLIVIVPGRVDLKTTPIWFGTPYLPEQVDAAMIQKERELAEKAGIRPVTDPTKIKSAMERGGEKLSVADRDQLRRELASVVRAFAPDEKHLADGLERIPASPKP